jgi:putative NADPH-quinone reductase
MSSSPSGDQAGPRRRRETDGFHGVLTDSDPRLEFLLLRTQAEFETGAPPGDIRATQEAIGWAEQVVIVYPLWLGAMPALLKGFLEQALRPGFAFELKPKGLWVRRLKGRSARIVVTMGMPAFFYRWYFGAHSLKSLQRNILPFLRHPADPCEPVRHGRGRGRCQASAMAGDHAPPRPPGALKAPGRNLRRRRAARASTSRIGSPPCCPWRAQIQPRAITDPARTHPATIRVVQLT